MIMESILDSISVSRPINLMYSKKSISPRKVYLVKCIELNMWCRAIIDDYMFTDHKVSNNIIILSILLYLLL